MVMTGAVGGSRTASREIFKVLSMTNRVFEEGSASGKAEENAHSSSSPDVPAGADEFAGGWGFAKSNMDF